jgi:hypothetical protein
MDRWLKDQNIDEEEFDRLLRDQALVLHARALAEANVERDLLDHLRITFQYGSLRERALEKSRLLAAHGLENPSLSHVGLTEVGLWRWYFEEALATQIPTDLAQYERSLDIANDGDFQRAVIRELCFVRLSENRSLRCESTAQERGSGVGARPT